MIAPDWLQHHPDLVGVEDAPAAAVAQATRSWGKSDRPQPLVQYQKDPVGFARDILGIPEHTIRWSLNPGYKRHEWDGDADPIAAMMEGLARGENVGVESGTGTGKSFGLAVVILWFVGCWDGARVYTFAPKEDQLRLFSWTEVRKLWPAFKRAFPQPSVLLTDLRIRMLPGSDEWGAVGYPVGVAADQDVAQNAAGMHAEHMLLIYEEGTAVPAPVYAAGENTCTDEHNLRLAVGNPDHQFDPLHKFCEKPNVTHLRASALDAPNVVAGRSIIPGAVGRKTVEERRVEYGEGGRLYLSRVRGISPSEAEDSLIRRSWLERAAARYLDPEAHARLRGAGKAALGVDVANSEGGDEAAIAEWQGAVLETVESFPCPDALKLAYRVQTRQALIGAEDANVGIDSTPSDTINKGKELGHRWQALNGGLTGKALGELDIELLEQRGQIVLDENEYLNLRCQMWWTLRVDLMRDRIALPPEKEAPQLWRDLLTPTWTTRGGRIVVESKEEIRKRLRRSPDEGDSTVYGNYVRDRRAEPEPEEELSAWDQEVLEHEARESRRVRDKPPARPITPITATEWIP